MRYPQVLSAIVTIAVICLCLLLGVCAVAAAIGSGRAEEAMSQRMDTEEQMVGALPRPRLTI